MNVKLTDKEKDYYKSNYSEALTEGLGLFKWCSAEVLAYILEILDPMTDARDVTSRKTLLTMAAVAYAKTELTKEILQERKLNETQTVSFASKAGTVKNKVDLSKI